MTDEKPTISIQDEELLNIYGDILKGQIAGRILVDLNK